MRVGAAKEIKPDESRVALTPAGARELVQRGPRSARREDAGTGSSFGDRQYAAVGALLVSAEEVWAGSDLLLKVKEPIADGGIPAL